MVPVCPSPPGGSGRPHLDDRADLENLLGFATTMAVHLLQQRQAERHSPATLALQVVDPPMVEALALHQHTDAKKISTSVLLQALKHPLQTKSPGLLVKIKALWLSCYSLESSSSQICGFYMLVLFKRGCCIVKSDFPRL